MIERFEHKKSLGQHFLNSDHIPKKMCDAAHVQLGDVVLEIGPGTGILTREILNRGARVIAVEADERAIASLSETFSDAIARSQLAIHHLDARTLDLQALGLVEHSFKVVANIPYYLSGLLFRQLLETDSQPTDIVFLIQKELAERIARDKKESLLSISVKAFGEPTYICTVKRGHFTPPPKVDSAIIAIHAINHDFFADFDETEFFTILKAGFANKRKQLIGNLSKLYPRVQLQKVFQTVNLPENIRAEDVSLDSWHQLVVQLNSTS